ncbi:radical SAM protein [Candidatus Collierbacteria bacterium]|nr:radical SAM protein [Candidatus Collierbacteria bacterium]
MKSFDFINLFLYGFRNLLDKWIYLYTGLFIPKPINFYIVPTLRCNARCKMCFIWAQKDPELTYSYWRMAINQIVGWCGPAAKINIAGGEILYSSMAFKLLQYSARKSFMTGLTSNGYLIDKKMSVKLIGLNLANINISLDGINDKTVNFLRGRSDFFEKTINAIKFLVEERNKKMSRTKIIIKTTIMGPNIKEIYGLVEMALKLGVDNVYFQPVLPPFEGNWTENQLRSSVLWPSLSESEVKNEFNRVIGLKKKIKGFILNSEVSLISMMNYLLGIPLKIDHPHCEIDLTTLFFEPRGAIRFCSYYQPIGHIKDLQKIKIEEMVKKSPALKLRKTMRKCGKNCLVTCMSDKSISDYFNIFSALVGWSYKHKSV